MVESLVAPLAPEIEKRLRRAEKHVTSMWFPVNPALVAEVKRSLEEGRYDLDPGFLAEDLKGDAALFTWVVKEASLIHAEKFPGVVGVTIPHLFRAVGSRALRELLSRDISKVTAHDFGTLNESQLSRLRATIVSVSAAEVLCECRGEESLDGYAVAQFRQMGLNLIAFNYPTVYRRALLEASNGGILDELLSDALGFSPSLLAMTIVSSWVIEPELLGALDTEIASRHHLAVTDRGRELARLCELGEALAEVNDPEHYPHALSRWEAVAEELYQVAGKDGVQKIRARSSDNSKWYAHAHPGEFSPQDIFNPEGGTIRHIQNAIIPKEDLRECSLPLQSGLEELSALVARRATVKEMVQKFVKEIVPRSGFDGVVIYTIEPEDSVLVPRLKSGSVSGEVSRISAGTSTAESIIAAAFRCSSPLTESISERGRTRLAISLGDKKKFGVLMLEGGVENGQTASRIGTVLARSLVEVLGQ